MQKEDDRQRLWVLIGLAGSGKTTFSRRVWEENPGFTLRVCLDEIIQMTSFYKYDPALDFLYGDFEKTTIVKALASGLNVIVDRTNLTRGHRLYFLNIGKKVKNMADKLYKYLLSESATLWELKDKKNLILKELQSMWEQGKGLETVIFDAFREVIMSYSEGESMTLFGKARIPSLEKHLKRVSNIEFVGVYFDVPPQVCLERRLKDPLNIVREQTQKVNWKKVLESMKKQLEIPSYKEGFNKLLYVNKDGVVRFIKPLQ